MRDLSAERQAAYAHLAEIVRKFVAAGRGTRSAGLKPAMLYTHEEFDENRLGFRSFRAFLEAAAEEGFVSLRPAPTGPDVDVLPPNAVAAVGREARLGRIRRDLWAAFVDWSAEWRRFYDKETGRVAWLPAVEEPTEEPSYAEIRKAIADAPDRYFAIEPIQQDATLEWMSEFVSGLDKSEGAALRTALTSARPIRAFVFAARETGLEDRWRAWRFERVLERINGWAAENQIELDLMVEREPITPGPRARYAATARPLTARPRGAPGGGVPLEELRDRVCAAVRRMSRGELLLLAIPLEYVLDDDR